MDHITHVMGLNIFRAVRYEGRHNSKVHHIPTQEQQKCLLYILNVSNLQATWRWMQLLASCLLLSPTGKGMCELEICPWKKTTCTVTHGDSYSRYELAQQYLKFCITYKHTLTRIFRCFVLHIIITTCSQEILQGNFHLPHLQYVFP